MNCDNSPPKHPPRLRDDRIAIVVSQPVGEQSWRWRILTCCIHCRPQGGVGAQQTQPFQWSATRSCTTRHDKHRRCSHAKHTTPAHTTNSGRAPSRPSFTRHAPLEMASIIQPPIPIASVARLQQTHRTVDLAHLARLTGG